MRLRIPRWITSPLDSQKDAEGLLRARLELQIRTPAATLAVDGPTRLFRPCTLRFLGT